MQERTIKLMHDKACPVFGTFHSVFYNILRQSSGIACSVITTRQKYRFFRIKLDEMGIAARDLNEMISLLSADISRYKTRLNLNDEFTAASVSDESFKEIYREYERYLRDNNCLDFDDMLLRCHKLLLRNGKMRQQWQKRFRYILIDEFQDIDELQYASIKLLLGKEKNLFIVGDDDQSIYRFRGAKPSIMLGFENDFEGVEKYVLDKNFRCASTITQMAGKLIAINKERFEKRIYPARDGGTVELPVFEDKRDEGSFICDRLKEGLTGSTAVLTRTGEGGEYIAGLFLNRGIRFSMKEKKTDMLAHFIALDICAYFKIALGNYDRADMLRVINRPVRYVSRQSMGDDFSFAAMKRYYDQKRDVKKALENLEKQMVILKGLSPYAGAEYVFRVVGYDRYLREEEEESGVSYDDIKQRILELLSGCGTKEEWICMVNRPAAADEHKDSEQCGVVISTLHASKGLEYDTVFIIDVAEGNIPGGRAVSPEDIEEERRLMYVGMTRARSHLYICRVKNIRGKQAAQSRFVGEILSTN